MDTDEFLEREELDAGDVCGLLATEVDPYLTQIKRASVLIVL